MNRLFCLVIAVFSLLPLSKSACFFEVSDRYCVQPNAKEIKQGLINRVRTRSLRHRVGDNWNEGPCVQCSCSAYSYEELLTCYRKSDATTTGIEDPPIHYVMLSLNEHFSGGCPDGMDVNGTQDAETAVQSYLSYRRVSQLVKSCCDNTERVTSVPDQCKVVRVDECKVKFVMKNDENKQCDGEFGVIG